jgi:hypothetical protein
MMPLLERHMMNQLEPDTALTDNAILDHTNIRADTVENRKYPREAAEANRYSCFVQEAALRIFTADLGKILVSDAVRRAEALADELEEQGYFRTYSPADFDLLD